MLSIMTNSRRFRVKHGGAFVLNGRKFWKISSCETSTFFAMPKVSLIRKQSQRGLVAGLIPVDTSIFLAWVIGRDLLIYFI
jgi:hypothetical protein